MILDIKNLGLHYTDSESAPAALSGITLSVQSGDFIVAVGPSGCGKTTLLSCLAGFLAPTSGSILLDGIPITGPSADRSVVFQAHALMPWLSVLDNVALGLRIQGIGITERRARSRAILDLVGLAGYEDWTIYALSGGMQQRVGIARALAADPLMLLMDEPLGALDAFTRAAMQEQVLQTWQRTQKTIFFITHDIEEAIFLATKLIIMRPGPGRIIETIDIDFSRRFLAGEDANLLRGDPAFQALRTHILDQIQHRAQLAAPDSAVDKTPRLHRKTRDGRYSLVSMATVLVLLASWLILTKTGIVKAIFLPGPAAIAMAFKQAWIGVFDGTPLYWQALESLTRVFAAFCIAALIGIPVGLAMGVNRFVRAALDPVIEFYRPLPPLAYLPLMTIWLGIGETAKITLIFLACFAPVALAARSGALAASPQQINAARAMGASGWQVMRHVILPAAAPDILVGLRIGMGVGWTTLVAAEMVAANAGLGQMILNASNFLRTDIVIVGIFAIGFFAMIFEFGMRWLESVLVPWKGKI